MRQFARAMIFRGDTVLLMYRRRAGKEYYIVPGGELEGDESPAEAVVREIKEETGYDIIVDHKIFAEENYSGVHHYFLVRPVTGEPVLGGEEAGFNSEEDSYRLDWIPFKALPDLVIVSPTTKELLLGIPQVVRALAS